MNKKLILLVALLSDVPVMAMERAKEIPSGKEASRNEEETLMKIRLTDSVNSEITHEVMIPVSLAKLIGALNNDLLEDPNSEGSVFPLPNLTIAIWRLIEPQLERVYGITHEVSQASQLRETIMTEFRKLDVKSLIGVVCALDYLAIPLLLECASEVIKRSAALEKISWEELEEVPFHIRNQIIRDKAFMLLGPVPAKKVVACRGHEGLVNSVYVTNDGKIFSGSYDKTVRVWDMEGNKLAVCRGHEDEVNNICVTKDGKIVSGSDDNTVRVWDMEGNQLAVCSGHEGSVNSVCVAIDGKIVSGSGDNTVRVWDMHSHELVVCRGHEGFVNSVCVTKEGKIVSGSHDKTVRVWDMEGNQLAVCRGHERMVTSVWIAKDGKIVSGSWDNTVRVWDMQGNQLALCRGHEDIVKSVCVTQEGKIVSGSCDKTVRVWDIDGEELSVCRGHEDAVRSVCLTSDGKIVSGSEDGNVRLFDMQGNRLAVCRGHEDDVNTVCVTKDGKIVSGSDDNTVRVWDISLLDRMKWIDDDRAQALWKFLQSISQQAQIDMQKRWCEIEKILGDDVPVPQATTNNNNNE